MYALYLANTISPEELTLFFALLKDHASAENWLGQLMDHHWDGLLEGLSADRVAAGRVAAELVTLERTAEPQRSIPLSPRSIPLYRRAWLSAAAALLILLVGAWFFTVSRRQSPIPAMVAKIDLPPGTNKAVLTLANGRQVVLDDAKNGDIAVQGGAMVEKLKNGQLAYTPKENTTAVAYNTLTTPRGGQHYIRLEDGTEIWLNAASSIRFPTAFRKGERIIEMTGEAYFKVTHRPSQPFHVRVNDVEVEDIGTEFNINGYADEQNTRTTLLRGAVRIEKTVLRPGQEAQVSGIEGIRVINKADTEQVVAWRNGFFAFHHTLLSDVMRQLSRWYDVDIIYEGKITDRYFGGTISRQSTAGEALKILEESNVHFRIEHKKIIVMD